MAYNQKDWDNKANDKGQKDGGRNSYDPPDRHSLFESWESFHKVERNNRPYDRAWNAAYKKRK
jgi:hypothetical protein